MKKKMKAKYVIITIAMLITISTFGNATALTTQTNEKNDTNTGIAALTDTIHVADVWLSLHDAPYAKVTMSLTDLKLEIKNGGQYFNFEVSYTIKAPGAADDGQIIIGLDEKTPTGFVKMAEKSFSWGGPEDEKSGTIKFDQDQLLYPDKSYLVSVNGYMQDYWGTVLVGWDHGTLTIETKQYVPKPDLSASGEIKGTNLKPTGSAPFNSVYVENVGESGSKLNWEIIEVPSFGTWSFTPSSGNGLTTGTQTPIEVWLEQAPSEGNKAFSGHVRIRNMDNHDNYVDIPVDITTDLSTDISVTPSVTINPANPVTPKQPTEPINPTNIETPVSPTLNVEQTSSNPSIQQITTTTTNDQSTPQSIIPQSDLSPLPSQPISTQQSSTPTSTATTSTSQSSDALQSVTTPTNTPATNNGVSPAGLKDLKVKIQKSEKSNCFTVVIKNKGEPLDFFLLSYRISPPNGDDSGIIEDFGTFSHGLNYYDIGLPNNFNGPIWFGLYIHLDPGIQDATCYIWFYRIGPLIFASPIYKSLTIRTNPTNPTDQQTQLP